MIKEKSTTIGYHCPHCGISILNSVNMFSFSGAGNLIRLKCPCGSSELIITITKDKKFRLSVPCIVCPNSHSYALSSGMFFGRELFSFSCKFTALNICFIGNSIKVNEAMKQNEQELLSTFAEYDDSFDSEMAELSDLFNWDEEALDNYSDDEDDWFEFDDLFGGYLDDGGADLEDEFEAIMQLLKPADKPSFEIYKNENFGSELYADCESSEKNSLDLSLYSGFSASGRGRDTSKNSVPGKSTDSLKIKNYPITSQILHTISQLLKDKKIYCRCNEFDGRILLLENQIHIECVKCGSERNIKSSAVSDIEYISEIGELYLDFD